MIRVDYISPDGVTIEAFDMADGMTLHQAACTICPDTTGKFPLPVIALVGDRPAVRSLGDWDHPLAGVCVQFRQLVQGGGGGGGGSNPLQTVMQIAIIALAISTSLMLGPGMFGIAGLGLNGFIAGLGGAAVMLLGTMLMGSLFPQKLPQGQLASWDAASASPTYSINSSGNQARLYQPEPEGFGRMKIVPDFVANTWTQYVGNDQLGYFVYSVGRGHYQIESLQFGETVFWRDGTLVPDTGYEILDLQIVEPGKSVTIFPDNVVTSTEVNGQELFAPNDAEYAGSIGPYTTNPAGTQTNRLLFDFVFQQGIGYYDDQGRLQYYSVGWLIEYQRIDDFGNPESGWATLEHCSFGGATLTPQRITKAYDVANGRYQARLRRTSNTRGDGRTMDSLVWGAMRAMLPGTLAYPQTCLAFSIRANNALTQNASQQFSIIATRKLPLYDRITKTWSDPTPTRSWAAAVSHVCKCEWGGRLADNDFDLDVLWAIDEKLQARGWHYDSYIDGPYLVWSLLNEMCQSQCVITRFIGPVLSFVLDAPNRPPSFALTPRNIVRGTFSINYVTWSDDTPDDVTVDYLDADYGFQRRDVTATLPESESREPSSLSILGITSRVHAHKVAVAYAAHNRWQRVMVECQVEALGRIINRGDICTVAHPRFRNTSAGAVGSWDEGTLSISLTRDMAKMLPEGADSASLYLALQKQDGSVWGPCRLASLDGTYARLDSGDYATLLLQGQGNPFEWLTEGGDRLASTWTLYTSREYQRQMVVLSVTTQDMLHFNLKLGNYDARIYQYEDLATPPWQGRSQLPTVEILDAPSSFRGVIQSRTSILLVWATVPGADWYDVEVSTDGQNWRSLGRANISQMAVTVEPGPVHARVRAASESLQSAWSIWQGNSDIPLPAAPAPRLEDIYSGGTASVLWSEVEHARSYLVAVRIEGQTVYTASLETPGFVLTPEVQQGGPWRELEVAVTAVGEAGASPEAVLPLADPAPDAITAAETAVGSDSVTLISVTPGDAADRTGYVIIKGDSSDFGAAQALELRQTGSLPYIWSDLKAGVHHFRLAVKDAFFDVTRNPLGLNWSAVLSVSINGAEGEDG